MKRVYAIALGGVASLGAAGLLLWRWLSLAFSPLPAILALLLLFGLPGALWLGIGARATGRRRMPRLFWVGLSLIAVGFLGTTVLAMPAATTVQYSSAPLTPNQGALSQGNSPSLSFVALPPSVAKDFRAAFPGYTVARVLHSSRGTYEEWLARPGAKGYAFQAIWASGQIVPENLQMNALFHPAQRKVDLGQLQRRVKVRKGAFLRPVRFPGYLLYVSLSRDQFYAVSEQNGATVEAGGSW